MQLAYQLFGQRLQIINDVVLALTAKGFSLPTSVIGLKNYDSSIPLSLKVETDEQEIFLQNA